MPLMTQLPMLFIANTDNQGNGVFTTNEILPNSIIEICPVIILSQDDTNLIHKTKLHDYYFIWDLDLKTSAIALGFGSVYNHNKEANAFFEIDKIENVIRIIAQKTIDAGEQIFINYIALEQDDFKLWFDPV